MGPLPFKIMKFRECYKCKEKIIYEKDDNGRVKDVRYKMVPLDYPYINLFFHVKCYEEVDDMFLYLSGNPDLCYN